MRSRKNWSYSLPKTMTTATKPNTLQTTGKTRCILQTNTLLTTEKKPNNPRMNSQVKRSRKPKRETTMTEKMSLATS